MLIWEIRESKIDYWSPIKKDLNYLNLSVISAREEFAIVPAASPIARELARTPTRTTPTAVLADTFAPPTDP